MLSDTSETQATLDLEMKGLRIIEPFYDPSFVLL